jgi:type VI secretion system secreted protein VgrG
MKYKYLVLSVVAALAEFPAPGRAQTLGSADSFAVLGGAGVTSAGDTILNGDVGAYPTATITGFLPGIATGTTYGGGPVAQQAEADALVAYAALAGETPIQDLSGDDLGGLTLDPGVRSFSAVAQLTGTLILDAQGDSDAQFDFQIGSALTTAPGANIILINGAQPDNIFWQVGSSATLGAGTIFCGSILANQSVSLDSGASVFGSVVGLNGAVTLIDNVVTAVPEPSSGGLLALGAAVFGARRWLGGRQRATGSIKVA